MMMMMTWKEANHDNIVTNFLAENLSEAIPSSKDC